jgi:hypothetical protein
VEQPPIDVQRLNTCQAVIKANPKRLERRTGAAGDEVASSRAERGGRHISSYAVYTISLSHGHSKQNVNTHTALHSKEDGGPRGLEGTVPEEITNAGQVYQL